MLWFSYRLYPCHCYCASSGALLLLNGDVIANNTDIASTELGKDAQALLCVTNNEDCCAAADYSIMAMFLHPNGTSVGESQSENLYVTKGHQIIRLNHHGNVEVEDGQYCCSVPNSQDNVETHCVNIKNKGGKVEA